ncbi:hypothetical protein D3C72_1472660 [compost metagenome]
MRLSAAFSSGFWAIAVPMAAGSERGAWAMAAIGASQSAASSRVAGSFDITGSSCQNAQENQDVDSPCFEGMV